MTTTDGQHVYADQAFFISFVPGTKTIQKTVHMADSRECTLPRGASEADAEGFFLAGSPVAQARGAPWQGDAARSPVRLGEGGCLLGCLVFVKLGVVKVS